MWFLICFNQPTSRVFTKKTCWFYQERRNFTQKNVDFSSFFEALKFAQRLGPHQPTQPQDLLPTQMWYATTKQDQREKMNESWPSNINVFLAVSQHVFWANSPAWIEIQNVGMTWYDQLKYGVEQHKSNQHCGVNQQALGFEENGD